MSQQAPAANLVNFDDLRLFGTRTVEVMVRGKAIEVTESLEDDSSVEKELGRARLNAQSGAWAAKALMAMPAEESDEKKAREADLAKAVGAMDALDQAVTFDRRRIVCRRIALRFTEWNIVGANEKPLPLDFDGLYDGPLSTTVLEELFQAVRDEPIVGN